MTLLQLLAIFLLCLNPTSIVRSWADVVKTGYDVHQKDGLIKNDTIKLENFEVLNEIDATESLNNIFSKAPQGCTVIFPKGIFNISGVVEVPRKCHIIGKGDKTIIRITKQFSCIGFVIKGDGSIVEKLQIRSDLDFFNNHDYIWGTKEYRANEDTGVMIVANNCLVRDIKVNNLRQGVWLGNDYVTQRFRNNRVENCLIDSCAICISAASQIKPVITNCSGSYITFDSIGWPPHFVYFTTGKTGQFTRDSYGITIKNIIAEQLDDYNMTAIQLKGCHNGIIENIMAYNGGLFSISRGSSGLRISDCKLHNGNGLNFRMISVSKAGGESCKKIRFNNITLQGKGDFIGFQDTKNVELYGLKVRMTEVLDRHAIFDDYNENLVVSGASFYVDGEYPVGANYSLIDCRQGSVKSLYQDIFVTPNYKGRININAEKSTFKNSFSRFNGTIYSSKSSSKIITDNKDLDREEIITEKGHNYDFLVANSFKRKKLTISSESIISRISFRLKEPFRENDIYRLPIGTSFCITINNQSSTEIELYIDEGNGMTRCPKPYFGKNDLPRLAKGREISFVLRKNSDGWAIIADK